MKERDIKGRYVKGCGKFRIGHKHSEETKKLIGDAHRGKVVSQETRKKLSEMNKGKIISEKTRKKISLANTGRVLLPETREKISLANSGKSNGMYGRYWDKNPNFSTGCSAYVAHFQRQGGKPVCEQCGKRGKFGINSIHVHHRDGNTHNNEIENLQPLCSGCHLNIHKNWEKRRDR